MVGMSPGGMLLAGWAFPDPFILGSIEMLDFGAGGGQNSLSGLILNELSGVGPHALVLCVDQPGRQCLFFVRAKIVGGMNTRETLIAAIVRTVVSSVVNQTLDFNPKGETGPGVLLRHGPMMEATYLEQTELAVGRCGFVSCCVADGNSEEET